MQIPRVQEPMDARIAQAVCNREGQVLFVHAAPLGLSVGDYVTDRLTAAERRFYAARSPGQAALLCTRQGKAVLVLPRVFGIDALSIWRPFSAPAAAVAAVADSLAAAMGLILSPRMMALCKSADDAALEAAYAELVRLHEGADAFVVQERAGGEEHIAALLRRLVAVPPLCMRQIHLDLRGAAAMRDAAFDEDVWAGMAFCLAVFLCRNTEAVPLTLTLSGTSALPVLLLSAPSPRPLPPGHCRLSILAERFPEAPELALCNALAERSGAEVEVYADAAGQLRIACAACRLDPAILGLKRPLSLSDAAAEAAEAEWSRHLPCAAQAGK